MRPLDPRVAEAAFLLHGRRFAAASLATVSIFSGLAEAAFLVILTRLALAVAAGEHTMTLVSRELGTTSSLLLAVAILLLRLIAASTAVTTSSRLSNGVIADVRRSLATGFLFASWDTQRDEKQGSLQELMTTFVNTGGTLMLSLTSGINAGFSLVALLAVSVAISPSTSVAVCGAVVLLSVALRPLRRRLSHVSAEAASHSMRFATGVSELSRLTLEISVYGVRGEVKSRLDQQIEDLETTNRRLTTLRGALPIAYTTLAYLVLILAIAVAAEADGHSLTRIGTIILVMLRALSYGQALQVASSGIAASIPFVTTLRHQIERLHMAREGTEGLRIEDVDQLDFNGVEFRYPGDTEPALQEATFRVRKGDLVAIVGPSGAGKSTLVQLILGLRQPTKGSIQVNGIERTAISPKSWNEHVGLVPQFTEMLTGSIRDNVAFFRPVSDGQIRSALEQAGLGTDLESWPEGLDRPVGEGGMNLSGGQRQRVSIARALVGGKDILVFDEPTSALDAASERLVRDNVMSATNAICFVVSHRPETLARCNKMISIESGSMNIRDVRSQGGTGILTSADEDLEMQ